MRAGWTILILLPLALRANVPKADVRSQPPEAGLADAAGMPVAAVRTPETSWSPLPFSHYEGILSRMPFGRPAPAAAAAAAAPVTAPPPAFSNKLTLCAINRTPAGPLEVGFVDGNVAPPRSYCMDVGESQESYTVLSADIDQECAVIDKDGVPVTLWLAGASRRVAPGKEPAPSMMAAASFIGITPVAAPLVSDAAPPGPPPKPMFTNSLEQLLSMELSVPLGVTPPPPPICGDLSAESEKALAAVIVIETNDTDNAAAQKENVGMAKEELRTHLKDGGTTISYLQSLRERRDAEFARQTAAREAAEAQINQLAKKLNQAELDKQLDVINKNLSDIGVDPIEAPDLDE